MIVAVSKLWAPVILQERSSEATPVGLKLTHPIGSAGRRLDHSAKVFLLSSRLFETMQQLMDFESVFHQPEIQTNTWQYSGQCFRV